MFAFDGYVTGDGECVCEFCTDGEDAPLDGELDSPMHCAYCGRPLDCALTARGVTYVFRQMLEDIAALRKLSRRARQAPGAWPKGHYYHGSPGYEVMLDWLDQIDGTHLHRKERKRIEQFRALCRPAERVASS